MTVNPGWGRIRINWGHFYVSSLIDNLDKSHRIRVFECAVRI